MQNNNILVNTIISSVSLFLILCIILFFLIKTIYNSSKRLTKTNYEKLGKSTQIRLINQLRETVQVLSETKTGALITIENNDNIDNLRTDGIVLDANISSSLLISIFNKNSPLHDGAVVIRNNKIFYAATFFKITRKSIDNHFGSRHRAAMGISEMCDAVTIIVSEETGDIKLVKNGIFYNVRIEQFQEQLIKYLKN
ncbi:diadenylate cyclase [Mycoplasmopsis hyopharyngis]|uniref:diadenylate cyclase n=1 Tax=Mycoplasmopsis hyopharyngis TaxID=29558 RepID=UPI0038738456